MLFSFAEDSAERADLAENQLGKLRAKTRSSVSVSRTSPGVSPSLIDRSSRSRASCLCFQREIRESTTTMRATSMIRASSVRQR